MIRKTPYLCILLLLVACGDDGGDPETPDAATDTPDATQGTPDAAGETPDAAAGAPTVSDQQVATAEDTDLAITIEASDPDNDALQFTLSDPASGTVAGTPPAITYTPDDNFNGTDTFTVEASDGVLTDTATITVTVTPVNDAPVATGDVLVVLANLPVEVELLATDVDGDNLTFTIVSQPENGTVTGEGSVQTYTHDDGFTGQDSFTFRASDGTLDSNVATFGILVMAPGVAR
jgi:hypothetical protein